MKVKPALELRLFIDVRVKARNPFPDRADAVEDLQREIYLQVCVIIVWDCGEPNKSIKIPVSTAIITVVLDYGVLLLSIIITPCTVLHH